MDAIFLQRSSYTIIFITLYYILLVIIIHEHLYTFVSRKIYLTQMIN